MVAVRHAPRRASPAIRVGQRLAVTQAWRAGSLLASCSGDRTVRVWARQQAGSEAWSCSAILEEAQTRTIRCCAWSPDGRCLATASFDATTAVWAVQARGAGAALARSLGSGLPVVALLARGGLQSAKPPGAPPALRELVGAACRGARPLSAAR